MFRMLCFLLLIVSSVTASAGDPVLLETDKTSATDGYWNTDQGYFVGCYRHAADRGEADLRLVSFRLGLVPGGRLHPGRFGVGAQDLQIIKNMSLVAREGDAVVLRTPANAEVDPGNHVHLIAQFHATADQLRKMEVEFEEHLDSGTRQIRVPLKSFLKTR